jgi:hypothetical protein
MGILHCRGKIPREFPTGIAHSLARRSRMKQTRNGVSLEGTGLRQDAAATITPVKARSNEASGRLDHLHLQNVTFSSERLCFRA